MADVYAGSRERYDPSLWAEKVFGTERKAVSPHPPTKGDWRERPEFQGDTFTSWRTTE